MEFLQVGFTAVEDVTGELIECAKDELFDALGFGGDEIDLRAREIWVVILSRALSLNEVATSWGPVFVFWDRGRATLKAAKGFVARNRPALQPVA